MNNTQQVPSAMALAFVNASVPILRCPGKRGPWMARRVEINADREIGMMKRPAWYAHLSKKTADKLIKQGIL